ncbi:MAG TPA: hypothetical protein VIS51_03380, partial [Solirubrobacterales bacterium]
SLPVVVALLTGCGGGDDSTESAPAATIPTTTAPTQAELLERGDAICAEVNAAVGTVGTSTETGGPAGQVAGLYSGMVDSLKGIGVPQESEGYPEFIAAAEALATAEDEVQLASEREDTASLESAESNASSALASFQTAADEYGFEDCSEGPSAPVSPGTGPESGETGSEAPEEPEAEAEEPEVEAAPEPAPETGGAGGAPEGGGTTGGGGESGSTGGDESGGIGPG